MIVTKKGQKFTVSLPTRSLREMNLFKENVVYICTDIVEFNETIEPEIYSGEKWINQSLTTVVEYGA